MFHVKHFGSGSGRGVQASPQFREILYLCMVRGRLLCCVNHASRPARPCAAPGSRYELAPAELRQHAASPVAPPCFLRKAPHP